MENKINHDNVEKEGMDKRVIALGLLGLVIMSIFAGYMIMNPDSPPTKVVEMAYHNLGGEKISTFQWFADKDKDDNATASEWANKTYIEFDANASDYGKISVYDINNSELLAEYTLLENTDECFGTDCYANLTVTLYQDGPLFEEFDFVTKKDKDKGDYTKKKYLDYTIRYENYEENVEFNEMQWVENCTWFPPNATNTTGGDVCHWLEQNVTWYENVTSWKKYKGENFEGNSSGITYNWTIEGKKDRAIDEIDWAFSMYGINTSEVRDYWAVWGSPLNEGLKAYWDFDENTGTNLEDKVTGKYNGTLEGTPSVPEWIATGIIGSSLNFTDDNQVNITGGDRDLIDETVGFTVSAWVNPEACGTSEGNYPNIFHYSHGSTATFGRSMGLYSNTCKLGIVRTNNGAWDTANTALTQGQWSHVVYNWNGTTGTFYLNGASDGSFTIESSTSGSTTGWHIGMNTESIPYSFPGQIDELGIWNRSLSEAEVLGLYNDGSGITYDPSPSVYWNATFDEGLVRYYDFNDSSSAFTENVGQSYNLTDNGSVIFEMDGIVGNAGYFDGGTNSFAHAAATGLPTGSSERTLSFWIYRNVTCDAYDEILGWASDGNYKAFRIRCNAGNQFSFEGAGTDWDNINAFASDQWVHAVFTFNDTNKLNYYEDGIYIGSNTMSPNLETGTAAGLAVGRRVTETINDAPSQVTVDEMGIWNRSLSASEIFDLYNYGDALSYTVREPEAPANETGSGPTITLNSPANGTAYNNTDSINFNCSAESDVGVHNLSLFIGIPDFIENAIPSQQVFPSETPTYFVNVSDAYDGDWNTYMYQYNSISNNAGVTNSVKYQNYTYNSTDGLELKYKIGLNITLTAGGTGGWNNRELIYCYNTSDEWELIDTINLTLSNPGVSSNDITINSTISVPSQCQGGIVQTKEESIFNSGVGTNQFYNRYYDSQIQYYGITNSLNQTITNSTGFENLSISTDLTFDDEGNYTWYCQANDEDNVTTSEIRSFSVDNPAPIVTLNSPANDSTYENHQTIDFNCSATDNQGVLTLEFYLDDVLNYTVTNTTANENLSYFQSTYVPIGNHTWRCDADDGTSITASETRNLEVYNPSPEIDLIYPLNNSQFESPETIEFQCNATDNQIVSNLSLFVYNESDSLIESFSVYNTTYPQNLSLQHNVSLLEGDYSWTCEADDGSSSVTHTLYVLEADNTPPTIEALTPANGTVYNYAPVDIIFNCSGGDKGGMSNLTLEIGGVANETIFNSTANQNLSLQKTIEFVQNGDYNWTCSGYDSEGLYNISETYTYTINGTPPEVTASGPSNNSVFAIDTTTTVETIQFNCSATDDHGVVNLSLYMNGVLNESVYNTTAQENLTLSKTIDFETYTSNSWSCEAYDILDQQAVDGDYYFNTTVESGNLTLWSPEDNAAGNFVQQFDCTYTSYDFPYESYSYTPVTNLTLYFEGDAIYSITNSTASQQSLNISYDYNIPDPVLGDSYDWNCVGINALNNQSTNPSDFSFTVADLIDITYNTSTLETDSQYFEIEWDSSATSEVVAANLLYNGTYYTVPSDQITTSGRNFTAWIEIDIPLVSSNVSETKEFQWEMDMLEGSNAITLFSSTYNQQVHPIRFNNCSDGLAVYPALNVTMREENYRTQLAVDNYQFRSKYWLGEGTVYREFNQTINGSITSHQYCVSNESHNFYAENYWDIFKDGYGFLGEPSGNAENSRLYIFPDETLNDTLQQRSLHMLTEDEGRAVKLLVQEGSNSLEGAEIKVYRYYSGITEPILIHNGETDSFGIWVVKLFENSVRYKMEVYYPKGVLRNTVESAEIFCDTGSECVVSINKGVLEDITNDRLDTLSDLTHTLSFDDTTNTFIYSMSDAATRVANFSLEVYSTGFNSEKSVSCQDSEVTDGTNRSLVLTCSLATNATGNYYASVFITPTNGDNAGYKYPIIIDGETRLYVELDEENLESRESLFWSMILLFIMVSLGAFAPLVGIVIYLAGYVTLGWFGLISMNAGVFFAQLVIGILFIVALNRREQA